MVESEGLSQGGEGMKVESGYLSQRIIVRVVESRVVESRW